MIQEVSDLKPMVYKLVKSNEGIKTADGKYIRTFLEEDRKLFKLPENIFGSIARRCDVMIKHYIKSNKKNCGVLLVGLPGTGKSMFGEYISNNLIFNNVPVIYIHGITMGDNEIKYLRDNCKNPVCIYIDEFEKICPFQKQSELLSILSDTNSNKFWIFTVNDPYGVNNAIVDRPGRIRYRINFNKLPIDVVEEYCEFHKVDRTFIADLLSVYPTQEKFSFDHLSTLVSEHLTTGSQLDEIKEYINISGLNAEVEIKIKDCKFNGEDMEFSMLTRMLTDHRKPFLQPMTRSKFKEICDNLRANPRISIKHFQGLAVKINHYVFLKHYLPIEKVLERAKMDYEYNQISPSINPGSTDSEVNGFMNRSYTIIDIETLIKETYVNSIGVKGLSNDFNLVEKRSGIAIQQYKLAALEIEDFNIVLKVIPVILVGQPDTEFKSNYKVLDKAIFTIRIHLEEK